MEIERKFLVKKLPDNLDSYSYHDIEQGYLCTDPVVRIRRQDDDYILTYKGSGFISREEYNLPLTEDGYYHLKEKADGRVIEKRRYVIPIYGTDLAVELDIFGGELSPLVLAEVEFPDEKTARDFTPLDWFDKDVSLDGRYHNSTMSRPDYVIPQP